MFCFSTLSIFKLCHISNGCGFSPQKTEFSPTIVSMGFVVDKTLQWQAFYDRFTIPLQFEAPAMICTDLSSRIFDCEVPRVLQVYLPSGTSLQWVCPIQPQRSPFGDFALLDLYRKCLYPSNPVIINVCYLFWPASCKMGTGPFPGVKCGRGVLLTTHLLLVPRS